MSRVGWAAVPGRATRSWTQPRTERPIGESSRTRWLASEGGGGTGATPLGARVAGPELPPPPGFRMPLPMGLICDSGLVVPLTTPCIKKQAAASHCWLLTLKTQHHVWHEWQKLLPGQGVSTV